MPRFLPCLYLEGSPTFYTFPWTPYIMEQYIVVLFFRLDLLYIQLVLPHL